MAEDSIYTQDGTITISKKPANKKKTGNWKACYFILGIDFILLNFILELCCLRLHNTLKFSACACTKT